MRWDSTPESVAQREPTILAITETLMVTLLYWGAAWFSGWYVPLMLGYLIVPCLLLRSESSAAICRADLQRNLQVSPSYLTPRQIYITILLGEFGPLILFATGILVTVIKPWHPNSVPPEILNISLIFFFLGSNSILGSIASACFGLKAEKLAWESVRNGLNLVASLSVFLILLPILGYMLQFSVGIALCFFAPALYCVLVGSRMGMLGGAIMIPSLWFLGGIITSSIALFMTTIFVMFLSGVTAWLMKSGPPRETPSFGLILRLALIHAFAILKHLPEGTKSFVFNLEQAMWSVDMNHPPEVVPGVLEQLRDHRLKTAEEENPKEISLFLTNHWKLHWGVVITWMARWLIKAYGWPFLVLGFSCFPKNAPS